MGWTFTTGRVRNHIDYAKAEMTWEDDDFSQRVLAHSSKGSAVYMLVERRPKKPHENEFYVQDEDGAFRFIAVALTSRRYGEFGCKIIEEMEGPCYYHCPKKLIKAASPLKSEAWGYAAKWRARVMGIEQ